MRSLVHDLRTIKTKQDLINISPKLEQRFNELVDVMLKAEQLRAEMGNSFNNQDFALSDELRVELLRIYQLPDGRELIERSQSSSLKKLEKSLGRVVNY